MWFEAESLVVNILLCMFCSLILYILLKVKMISTKLKCCFSFDVVVWMMLSFGSIGGEQRHFYTLS